MRYTRSVVSTSEVLNINSYLYGIVADYNRTNLQLHYYSIFVIYAVLPTTTVFYGAPEGHAKNFLFRSHEMLPYLTRTR